MAIITMIVILIVKDCLTKLTLQKDYLRKKTEHLGKIKYKVFNKHTWTSHIVCTTRFSRLRKCYLTLKLLS